MYSYAKQRKVVFTDEGQRMLFSIRDRVKDLLAESRAFTLDAAIKGQLGNSWDMLACVDRLVEMGEIREITYGEVAAQDRVFVASRLNKGSK